LYSLESAVWRCRRSGSGTGSSLTLLKLRAEYERIKGFEPKVAERIRMEFGLQPK